jgi:hypothetical protein
MRKRIRKEEPDVNQLAQHLVQKSTGQAEEKSKEKAKAPAPHPRKRVPTAVSEIMAAMGRRGGKIGGKRRAARMTEEQRSNAAALAARARWAKKEN